MPRPALGGLSGTAMADLSLDPGADAGIDAFPAADGAAQHRFAHPAQKAARDLIHQFGALPDRHARIFVLPVPLSRMLAAYTLSRESEPNIGAKILIPVTTPPKA